jgi:hypothetical protein
MGQTTQFDSNNAYSQVRKAIQGLIDFNVEDDQDDVLYAANKLITVLRKVHDNDQSWSNEAVREFVIIKNDPLRYIHVRSDQFNQLVRTIQEDMIIQFS